MGALGLAVLLAVSGWAGVVRPAKKVVKIAAKKFGGKPEQYEVANERVFRKGGSGMTLAQAAKRAIDLGGIYDGHEIPKGVNKMTAASAQA